jgi:hypothetical protein
MIIKGEQVEIARTNVTRAELREQLIELWAQVFERELRADLDAAAVASGERDRLRAIDRAEPPAALADLSGDR